MIRRANTLFRCISCAAFWPQHWPTCARCWSHGSIIPWSERPRAAVDSVPGASNARALSRMAWQPVEQSAYPELRLGVGAFVAVSGLPGAGKSSWACRLADAVKGPALLLAAEEGLSPSLAARLLRCNIKRADFHVLSRATVDATVRYARQVKAISMIVDSVQEAAWTASELRHVIEVVDSLVLLVAVLQVTKAGLPAGSNTIQHEADVRVRVESMRWWIDNKSRYQDPANVGGDVLTPRKDDAA